jgi:lipoprotein-anchoring transpeptidase ErfK/SrfK
MTKNIVAITASALGATRLVEPRTDVPRRTRAARRSSKQSCLPPLTERRAKSSHQRHKALSKPGPAQGDLKETGRLNLANRLSRAVIAAAVTLSLGSVAFADPLKLADAAHSQGSFHRVVQDRATAVHGSTENSQDAVGVSARLRRQLVDYLTQEASGTIIIDTSTTYLYLVLGDGKAMRYGIGVGREGFTWSGVETIARKAEWPDWYPPADMIQRQPYLPRMMAGGPGNPLGARALYLGSTAYRIHGTNQPATIGRHISSGCIRMANDDVVDLYVRVNVGTKVVVKPAELRRAPNMAERVRTIPAMTSIVSGASPASSLY